MRLRLVILPITRAVILGFSAACSGGSGVLTLEDGTRVVVGLPSSEGVDAIISGNLVVLPDRCLGIEVDGVEYLAIFPSGTSASEGHQGIEIDSKRYLVGDMIGGTGGEYSKPYPVQTPNGLPQECETPSIVVFQDIG